MRIKFFIIILLQVLILIGIILYKQHWIKTSEKIFLKVWIVDPRDILRGDYIHLNYDISKIDVNNFKIKDDLRINEKIYVSIERYDDYIYYPVSISRTKPSGLFLKGRIKNKNEKAIKYNITFQEDSGIIHNLESRLPLEFDEHMSLCVDKKGILRYLYKGDNKNLCKELNIITGTVIDIHRTEFTELTVEYGIEKYFVEEGRGKNITSGMGNLIAEIAVKKSGDALISALYTDNLVIR